jgi:hypothetical protein
LFFSASFPTRPFTEREIKHYYTLIKPLLYDNKFLLPDEAKMIIDCPENPEDCFLDVFVEGGQFFGKCCRKDIPLIEIDPEKVHTVRADMKKIGEWLGSGLGIKPEPKEVNQWLWHLGQHSKGHKIYLCYTNQSNYVEEQLMNLTKQNSKVVVLWLGDTPHEGVFPKNIVPLWEMIRFSEGKVLFIANSLDELLSQTHMAVAGDIELDKHIVLHKEGVHAFLLLQKKNQGYEHKVGIRPQSAKIIEFMCQVRSYNEFSFKLDDLRGKGFAMNKNTISTRIKDICDLCDEYHIKRVLTKYADHKWGLNKELDCC